MKGQEKVFKYNQVQNISQGVGKARKVATGVKKIQIARAISSRK